jgi:TonB family protein
MIVQNRKYSGILHFLAVSLLLSISFVFSTGAQESPENTYGYSLDQIDKKPAVIQKVFPVYPYSAQTQGIRARVKIQCLVDKDGSPQKIEAIECDPEDAIDVFGPPAVDAVKEWRFSPGEIGGEPVPTRVAFNMFFELPSQTNEVTP